ncbi:hypothetical protein [Streptomyces lasalocidi]|uniref:Uncharacterized protein n=1 Tax=Streptomyces lasalocidi TaxID=324833 RepID=A0A4U5WEA6_STRLS|nr:hypothetical protein [Streptomyces lasalocidi]TKS98695.1 hypothetical protein E4U91_00075 [Streptomyces lasalocidi]
MSTWGNEHEQSAIRLLAVWALLERSEQALSNGSRTPEDSVQAEGGQLAGWPPAPAPCPDDREQTEAKGELVLLLARECAHKTTAPETRRIAELLEYLNRDEEAMRWWQWAAERGDEDARDYLEMLHAERYGQENPSADSPTLEELENSAALYVWKSSETNAGSHTFAAVQLALSAAVNSELSEDAKQLVREIEEYLQHPDRMTDGRRR